MVVRNALGVVPLTARVMIGHGMPVPVRAGPARIISNAQLPGLFRFQECPRNVLFIRCVMRADDHGGLRPVLRNETGRHVRLFCHAAQCKGLPGAPRQGHGVVMLIPVLRRRARV